MIIKIKCGITGPKYKIQWEPRDICPEAILAMRAFETAKTHWAVFLIDTCTRETKFKIQQQSNLKTLVQPNLSWDPQSTRRSRNKTIAYLAFCVNWESQSLNFEYDSLLESQI